MNDKLIMRHIGLFKFVALFLALLWGFNYLYTHFFLGQPVFEQYLNLCVSLATKLLNFTGEQIQLARLPNKMLGEINSHDGAYIRFSEGTDGIMIMATLVAAIAAWPASIFKKIPAIILGAAFICVLNILRLFAMLKVDVYWALQFDLMNTWMLPGAMILAALGFFLVWTKVSGRHPSDGDAT